MHPIEVFAQDLPAGDTFISSDNTLRLPSPIDVRARAEQQGIGTSSSFRLDPVIYSELGLIIKWGVDVTVAEGQCLWFLTRHLRQFVSVPRIFGWQRDGTQTFLYLELVQGDTLTSRWHDLSETDKSALCGQLRGMIASWRQIVKPPGAVHQLSQIGDQGLRDIMFHDGGRGEYPAGPFRDVSAFHDFLAGLINGNRKRDEIEELAGLADDTPVVFTHADLDQSNILISRASEGPLRIVAIIDWHQSGWYPEPWELLKAQSVGVPDSDWVKVHLPTVLDAPKFEYYYAWEYVSMSTI